MQNHTQDFSSSIATIKTFFGFGLSIFLIWFTFRSSGLRLSDINLYGVEVMYMIGAMAIFIFSLWLYSLRAKLVWRDIHGKGAGVKTYSSLILGNFYNCLLPGNLGEGIRAWHFSRNNDKPLSRSLAGIITEKWLDAQVFAVLVLFYFFSYPPPSSAICYCLLSVAAGVVFLSIIYYILVRFRSLERAILFTILRLGKVGRFFVRTYTHATQQLANMHRNKSLYYFIFYFIAIFFLNGCQFYFIELASGIEAPVAGFRSAFLISMSMMIIAFIPAAPSGVGVVHYGLYLVLLFVAGQYGIAQSSLTLKSYALFGVYAHLSFLIPEIALGLVVLWRERRIFIGT